MARKETTACLSSFASRAISSGFMRPIWMIPDVSEVRAWAHHLHATGQSWEGEIFGWPAAYAPERRKRPGGSKMRFTPADFWIGESGIWFYSLMWEHGK